MGGAASPLSAEVLFIPNDLGGGSGGGIALRRAIKSLPRSYALFFGLVVAFCPCIPGRAEDIHATLQHAEELAKAGRADESNLLYREALQFAPQCWRAYLGMGRNYFGAGQYENAAAAFQQAVELQPSNPDFFNWLGRSYIQRQHPEKLLDLLSRANSTITNSPQAHLLLSRVYDARDETDMAKHEIDLALKIDPHCHGAHFAHGFIDWSIGDLQNAEKEFRQETSLIRTKV